MQIVEKMTPMFPNLPKFKEKLSTQFMVTGIERFQKKDTSTAFNYLTKSLVADSSNTKAWNNLAKAYYETNDLEKAIINYETTLKLDSKNKVALDAIALIRNKKGVNNEELQEALKQLANDKKNPDNWCRMGDILFTSGSFDKARACYQSALKLKADHQNAKTGLEKIEALSK
jgi:cytochrome c-type biogenesis protein CcmH/NrfG